MQGDRQEDSAPPFIVGFSPTSCWAQATHVFYFYGFHCTAACSSWRDARCHWFRASPSEKQFNAHSLKVSESKQVKAISFTSSGLWMPRDLEVYYILPWAGGMTETEEFLPVKCLKFQNPNESLWDLLLVLTPKLQEGGQPGAQEIAEDAQQPPGQQCKCRAWSHQGEIEESCSLPAPPPDTNVPVHQAPHGSVGLEGTTWEEH